jgi:parallel beta-helix repeat protein
MGSANIQSGRFSAPKALKRAFRLAAIAALTLSFAPSRAAAQTPGCPQGPLTSNLTLTADITATTADTTPCITIGADNVTLNLGGHTINITALGDTGVAISTGTTNNTTIIGNNGTIKTEYSSALAANTGAIESTGGTNLSISGVTLQNLPGGNPCLTVGTDPDTNWGMGISANGVTGATIGSNTISCYAFGIYIQSSAIPSGAPGSISGNNLSFNAYYMAGGPEIYSAGLVLSNSSGWSVSGNTIQDNGSPSPNGICTSPTSGTGVNTCAFGLQIINGSTSNTISSNTVDSNFVGGIYAGPDTSGNTFSLNTALTNALWDVWDDAPSHANSWHRNTCGSAGGTLNSHMCHG